MSLLSAVPTLVLALMVGHATNVFGEVVKDPLASVVNVSAQQAALRTTHDPVLLEAMHHLGSCVGSPFVAPPPGRMIVPGHYLSGSSGPINPAEAPAAKVYEDFEKRVDAGMNRYLATGDHRESACAPDQMDAWATAGGLLNYDRTESQQAWYFVEWTLCGIGISQSVMLHDRTLDMEKQQRVMAWLDKVSHKSLSFESMPKDGNNHHYWRALHAVVIGTIASDNDLFQLGIDAYKGAIAELNPDGSLPREMARKENALAYQGFALEPLILIAQFASRQGIDLYSYEVHGRTILDAVMFFGRALDDPALIKPYASDKQTRVAPDNERLAPLPFIAARFKGTALPKTLRNALRHPVLAPRLGGVTVLFAGR